MRLVTLLFAVSIFLANALACFGQQIITLEQAKEAVRSFEGEAGLQFSLAEYEEYQCPFDEQECLETPGWIQLGLQYGEYKLEAGERPDVDAWSVDPLSGEVWSAYHDGIGPSIATWPPPEGPLTHDDCRQIAEDFARAKYAEFDTMGFQLMTDEWDGRLWRFEWEQVLAYGAIAPNSVRVEVNSEDGAIGSYTGFRIPTPTPSQPQVTAEQAIEIGRTDAGIVTPQYAETPILAVNPDNTYWAVDVRGLDANGEYVGYVLNVDVVTGQVLYKGALGVAAPAAERLVPIRDVTAKVPRARVHWLGKEARLFIGKNRYTLVPGKDTIEWTGGTIKLSQKMKVVNGHLMVPSGLLDVLKSAPAPKKAPPTPKKSN